jgi:hypothetical protein
MLVGYEFQRQPIMSAKAKGGNSYLNSPRAARYPRLEEYEFLMPVQVVPLSFGEDPNINWFTDLYSHLF